MVGSVGHNGDGFCSQDLVAVSVTSLLLRSSCFVSLFVYSIYCCCLVYMQYAKQLLLLVGFCAFNCVKLTALHKYPYQH